MKSTLKVQLLHKNARLPSKSSKGSAGFDLYASEEVVIPASRVDAEGQFQVGKAIAPIGIAVQLPSGTVGKIASRSGLSVQLDIEVGAGWIDCDYRGELVVELRNFGAAEYRVLPGDRVAQLIVLEIPSIDVAYTNRLDNTERGSQGLGSSGR